MSTENEKRKAIQHSIHVAELRLEQLQKRKAAKTMSRSEMFELEMTVAVIKRGKSLLNEKVADPMVNPVGEACQGVVGVGVGMTHLTDAELAELGLHDKARTQGVWEWDIDEHEIHAIERAQNCGDPWHIVPPDNLRQWVERNGPFITAAANALPLLLAEVREAREKLTQAEQLANVLRTKSCSEPMELTRSQYPSPIAHSCPRCIALAEWEAR